MDPPPSYTPLASTGLESLAMLSAITVQQRKDLVEVLTGWECKNRYVLRNERGEQVYYALEDSHACERFCFGHARPYTIHIIDNFNRRELKLWAGCCWLASACDACAFESTVEAPPGNVIARIRQRASCCITSLTVLTEKNVPVYEIDGADCCRMYYSCGDKEFPIYTLDRHLVGSITKQWGGLCKEACTRADTFGVTFSQDMDVTMKAALLGATFLLDYTEFENSGD